MHLLVIRIRMVSYVTIVCLGMMQLTPENNKAVGFTNVNSHATPNALKRDGKFQFATVCK